MRNAFLVLCVLLIPLQFFCIAEEKKVPAPRTVRELPGNTPYFHPESSLLFPPAAASYRKEAVMDNANPVYGTVIRYRGRNGESADIYLYSPDTKASPIEEKALLKEYRKTRDALLKKAVHTAKKELEDGYGALPQKEEIRVLKEEIRKGSGKFSTLYRCDFACSIGDNKYDSLLILALVKGQSLAGAEGKKNLYKRFMKIRLSRPAEVTSGAEETEKFLQELLKGMQISVKGVPQPDKNKKK